MLKVTRAPKHGQNFMFILTGLNLGETMLNAVAADGASWDSVSIHVHMARKKQLPSWDDLFDNYAGDEEASDDFRTRIGGAVDNSQLSNTCTLRMSEAFNGAGQAIPEEPPRPLHRARRRKEELRSARRRVQAVHAQHLRRAGHRADPARRLEDGVLRTDFSHLRGVMCFEVHFADATGHFTLWDGTQPVHGDYFARAYRVSLWIAG